MTEGQNYTDEVELRFLVVRNIRQRPAVGADSDRTRMSIRVLRPPIWNKRARPLNKYERGLSDPRLLIFFSACLLRLLPVTQKLEGPFLVLGPSCPPVPVTTTTILLTTQKRIYITIRPDVPEPCNDPPFALLNNCSTEPLIYALKSFASILVEMVRKW